MVARMSATPVHEAEPTHHTPRRYRWLAAATGAAVGLLGGMIGLGGAEFRLPLLIGLFGFLALQAVILNKAMSLLVVATALPARLVAVPLDQITPHWPIIVNLLAGSLLGAYLGATWATRMASRTLYRVLAGLLMLIAAALLATHLGHVPPAGLEGPLQAIAGLVAGAGIGVVAALVWPAGNYSSRPSCCSTAPTSRSPAASPWRCRSQQCWSHSPGTARTNPSSSCNRTAPS